MTFYIAGLALLTLLALGIPYFKGRGLAIVVGAAFILIAGPRYSVGCDFQAYLNRFEDAAKVETFDLTVISGELGFDLLQYFVQSQGLGFPWLNTLLALIYFSCLVTYFRQHPWPLMSLLMAFPLLVVQLGMSGVRQALALGFLTMAWTFFFYGKRALTAGSILIGATFHASAIIFLPIAFLVGRRISMPRLLLAIALIAPFAVYLLGERTEVYVNRYIDEIYGEMESNGALFRSVLNVIPAALLLRYRQRMDLYFPAVSDFLKMFAVIAIASPLLGLVNTVVLHRINYYLIPVTILMLVYLSLLPDQTGRRNKIYLLGPLMYGSYFISWLLTSRHASVCFTPYRSYLFL